MKNFKLIPMLEFVLEQDKKEFISETDDYANDWTDFSLMKLDRINNYANFLNLPLKPEMFYPCDENGIFLYEPEYYKLWLNSDHFFNASESVTHDCKEYKKACEKILFTNTSRSFDDGIYWLILGEKHIAFYDFNEKFKGKILEGFAFRKDLTLKEEAFNRIFL